MSAGMLACVRACVCDNLTGDLTGDLTDPSLATLANPNQLSPTQPNSSPPDPTEPSSTESNPPQPNPTQPTPVQTKATPPDPPPTQSRSRRTSGQWIGPNIVWEADCLGDRMIDPANNYPSIRLEVRSAYSPLSLACLQAGLSSACKFHGNERADGTAKKRLQRPCRLDERVKVINHIKTRHKAVQNGRTRTAPGVYTSLVFDLHVSGGSIGTVPGRPYALERV